MKDFARYVILSPGMSAMAAPAMARTTAPGQTDASCETVGFDSKNPLGFEERPVPSKLETLGHLARRPHP